MIESAAIAVPITVPGCFSEKRKRNVNCRVFVDFRRRCDPTAVATNNTRNGDAPNTGSSN